MKPSILHNLVPSGSTRSKVEAHGLTDDSAFAGVLGEVEKQHIKPAIADLPTQGIDRGIPKDSRAQPSFLSELEQLRVSNASKDDSDPDDLPNETETTESEAKPLTALNSAKPTSPNLEFIFMGAGDLRLRKNPNECSLAGGAIQPRHAKDCDQHPNDQIVLNPQPSVAGIVKPSVERRQTMAPLDSEQKRDAHVVPADGQVAQRGATLEAVTNGNTQETKLSESFSQLIASELHGHEVNTAIKLALHFGQAKEGSEVKRLKLQLQPEELGKLTLSLYRNDDGLRIVVHAQTDAAHAKFTAEKEDILRSLDLMGVSISEISIQAHSGMSVEREYVERGQSLQTNFGQAQSGQERSGSGSGQTSRPSKKEDEQSLEAQTGVYI